MPTIVAALLWSLLFASSAFGPTGDLAAATLFPPRTYVRTTGEPNVFADTFPCRPGHSALLVVESGPGGTSAASSARVALNGIDVLRERDFKPDGGRLEAPVIVQGENALAVRLAGKPGSTIRVSVVSERPCLEVLLTAPAPGGSVPAGLLLVRGVVRGATEVGVTVNEYPAAVEGDAFAVVVPVDPEETELRAVVTTADGATADARQGLVVTPAPEAPVRLGASPTGGPAPLEVGFSLSAIVGVGQVALESRGNGVVDFRGADVVGQAFVYPAPGLYVPRVEATDVEGRVHVATTLLHVYDPVALDRRLQSMWRGLTDALRAGDVGQAARYLHSDARDRYVALFTRLGAAGLANIDRHMTAIRLVEVGSGGAQYEMLRERDGQTLSFAVWFQLDLDGLWRVRRF